jgi:glutamine amidotransferase
MPARIVIVDYGSSNLRSVAKAFEHVAGGTHEITVTSDARSLARAERVVFPGQGAIGDCMQRLRALGLIETLRECVKLKPFFGICLGLQSLVDFSEEDGGTECLGVLPGRVRRFPEAPLDARGARAFKIPHMGWNEVHWAQPHPLLEGIPSGSRFYFVHSYYVDTPRSEVIAARTEYGIRFVSAIATGNAFATQFHPEKSQQAGLRLIRNFLEWRSGAAGA